MNRRELFGTVAGLAFGGAIAPREVASESSKLVMGVDYVPEFAATGVRIEELPMWSTTTTWSMEGNHSCK